MRKKRIISLVLALVMIFTMIPAVSYGAENNNDIIGVVTFSEFNQTEARRMYRLMNDFRTGKEAWAYNENNEKVYYHGLKKLSYDYYLETVAMIRASEIAVRFSHTSPNGELCFQYGTYGENIAFGANLNANDALELLKETNYKYNGQGHRRNMLDKDFVSTGIGHVKVGGYDFWVQEFGFYNQNPESEKAIDRVEPVWFNFSLSEFNKKPVLKFKQEKVVLKTGQQKVVKAPYFDMRFPDECYHSQPVYGHIILDWKPDNKDIVAISENVVIGVKPGTTTLRAQYKGKKYAIPVTVIRTGKWVENNTKYRYDDNGEYAKGLTTIKGVKYYFDKNGVKRTGKYKIGKNYYYFSKSGAAVKRGWINDSKGRHLYYSLGDGKLAVGAYKISGKIYRFNKEARMVRGKHKVGKTYYYHYMNSGVAAKRGWINDSKGKHLYYSLGNGKLATGRVKINGKIYSFTSDGRLK